MLDTSKTKFEINGTEINGVYAYSKGAGTNGEVRHRALADGKFRYLPTGHNETLLSMQVYDQSDAGINLLKLASTNSRIFDLVITYQDGAVESTKAFVRNITAQGGKRNGAAIGLLNVSIRMTDVTQITPPLSNFFAVSRSAGQPLYLGAPAPISSPFYEVSHSAGQTLRLGSTAPLPVNDFYTASVTSGSQLNLGVGSMLLWSPQRDVSGNVTASSLAEIPVTTLDELHFVEVEGFDPVAQISTDLAAKGFDVDTQSFGSGGKVSGTILPWVGQVYNEATKIALILWGGGHDDQSMNGIWRIDYAKMKADVMLMPSNPDDPTYPWSPLYKTISGYLSSGINYSGIDLSVSGGYAAWQYEEYFDENGMFHKALPDGRPTSAHTYQGVGAWNDGTLFTIRNCYRYYDPATGNSGADYTFNAVTGDYLECGPNQYMVKHDASDSYFGRISKVSDDYHFGKVSSSDPTQITRIPIPNGFYSTNDSRIAKVSDDEFIFWNDLAQAYVKFNMSTESFGPVTPVTDAFTTNGGTKIKESSMPCMYIPEWGTQGVLLTHYAGVTTVTDQDGLPANEGFVYLDLADNTLKRVIPTGATFTNVRKVENKVFISEMHGMKFIIYFWAGEGVPSKVYMARIL